MRGARTLAGLARLARLALPAIAGVTALVAAGGCHDLPDLGSCGNGVVEEANGEACDDSGDSGTCTASCTLRCTPDAAKPSYVIVGTAGDGPDAHPVFCPGSQFQCGTDQICRAPSGFFEPAGSPLPFDIGGAPLLGDVDNDGLLDLIGTSPTQIYTRFASTFGSPLGEVVVQDAPSSDAPYAIFDRNLGPRDPARSDMQLAIPTEGVALLRSDGERFAPELELPIQIAGGPLGLAVRDPDSRLGDVILSVAGQSATSEIAVARVPVKAPNRIDDRVLPQSLPSCTGPGAGAWRTLFVQGAPDRRSFVVVIQRDSTTMPPAPQPWHLCRYTHAPVGMPVGWTVAQLDFPAPAPPPISIAHANIDADPCLELAMRFDGAPGLSALDTAADCGLVAGLQPILIRDAGLGLGLLAAGQLVGAGADELVLQGGLYQMCTGLDCPPGAVAGTYVRVAQPTKVPWNAATVVDLNGDGVLDAVAARGNEADVDVVRGGPVSANVYRASTSAPITSLAAGDFDGDHVGDAAMVEAVAGGDRIVVLFGTQEAIVGTPIAMTGPSGHLLIDRVGEAPWHPSKRGADGIDDLLVVEARAGSTFAGLLIGDAARLMTSPRFSPASVVGTSLRGLATGPFTNMVGSVEILALTDSQALLYDVTGGQWSGELPIPPGLGPPIASLRDGAGGVRGAVHGPGNNGAEIVVFSARGLLFSVCRANTAGGVAGMHAIDIDGDGIDEVAVQYGTGGRLVQVFRVTGGPGCALERVLADALGNCIDLASTGSRLIAICRASDADPTNQVIAIDRTADGRFVRSAEIARVQGDGRFATAGDFDGDGVPDLVVGVRRVDAVGVQLLRQCPAHDTRTCVKPQPARP